MTVDTTITLCLAGAVALELVALIMLRIRMIGLERAVEMLAAAYLKKGTTS